MSLIHDDRPEFHHLYLTSPTPRQQHEFHYLYHTLTVRSLLPFCLSVCLLVHYGIETNPWPTTQQLSLSLSFYGLEVC